MPHIVIYMLLAAVGFYFGKWLGAIGLISLYFFYFHSRKLLQKQQQDEHNKQINTRVNKTLDLSWAYKELEISEDADKNTVAQARKKLLNQFHPDKLGKASDFEKHNAERKVTTINKAFNAIKKARGF